MPTHSTSMRPGLQATRRPPRFAPRIRPLDRRRIRLLFPRIPLILGDVHSTWDPWTNYDPAYIRWQESMLPNWNGSMMEFWSMSIHRVLANGSAKDFAPNSSKIIGSPDFWPRVRAFLNQWIGPSYFVQEMQSRMSPDWMPVYPLPNILQLRGQVPTYQWTGREAHHAGMWRKTGPLLGYGTPYSRQVALAAAKLLVAAWNGSGNVGAIEFQDIGERFIQATPTSDFISRLAASSLVESAAEPESAAEQIPITTAQCVTQGLAMLKIDPQLWAEVLEQAGSEQAVQAKLEQSCAKLVDECGGMTLEQCIDKLCPNMSEEQCKAVIKQKFGIASQQIEKEESKTPWWLIGIGTGLAVVAAGAGYYAATSPQKKPRPRRRGWSEKE